MMGDEDEGFDEEFCDLEDPPLRGAPDLPPLNLQDLNSSDLQMLFAESSLSDPAIPTFPTTNLFDDNIDPGVYMLEAENSTHSLLDLEPRKSPLHSPFSVSVPFPVSVPSPVSDPSPVCVNINSLSLTDSAAMATSTEGWNFNPCQHVMNSRYAGTQYGSSIDVCAPSHYLLPPPSPSSSPPLSAASCNCDLDFLVSMCSHSSAHPTMPAQHASSGPGTSYQQEPANVTCNFGNRSSPSLPVSTPPSLPASTSSSSGSLQHTLTSSPSHTCCEYSPLLNGQLKHAKGCTGSTSSPHGAVTEGVSCSTQTPLASSHTPASTATSSNTASLATSSDESDVPKRKPVLGENIVHMPFYQFKKILDSPSVPDEKKCDIKTVRRRGKNKIAAKTCRQRKLDIVMALQQEIEQLKVVKSQISGRTNSLRREIELLKTRCSACRHQSRTRTS